MMCELGGCMVMQRAPKRSGAKGRRLTVLALAGLTAGASCTMNADVARWSGPDEVGRIVRSDAGALYVNRAGTGETVPVPRADVRNVSHPGKALMIVGGILLGFWVFRMTDSRFRQDLLNDRPADVSSPHAVPITFLFAVPGAALFSVGELFYTRSRQAAANTDPPGAPQPQ